MGLPTRLHGDQVLDKVGLVEDFCPHCTSIRKWKVIVEDGKFYKRCKSCKLKKEVKDPNTILKAKKALAELKVKSKKGENKKKDKKK